MLKSTAIVLTGLLTTALTTFTALSEEGDKPDQNPEAKGGERPEQPDRARHRKPGRSFQRDGEEGGGRPQPPRDGEPLGGPRPTEEELKERRDKMRAQQLEMVNRIIKKFDEDGDGKLGAEELVRAIEMARTIGVLGRMKPEDNGAPPPWKPVDANQDGPRDEGERARAQEEIRNRRRPQAGPDLEAMREKFDADGDGKLNEEEQARARAFMQENAEKMKTENRKRMLKKFDTDGDGKLSEEEEAQARKTMQKHERHGIGPNPERLVEKFDADGDGKLNEEEQGRANEAMRKHEEKMLERFDADGDGKLNEEERRKAMQERDERGARKGQKREFKKTREGEGPQPGGEGERLDF